jgi:DNA polymerase
MVSLQEHLKAWRDCVRCQIGRWAAHHVFWRGTVTNSCRLLCVGLAPGRSEDALGEAFIGRSGRLLQKVLQDAEVPEANVMFVNLLLCRPCETRHSPNRDPSSAELYNCRPRLREVCQLLRPKGVALLGQLTWSEMTTNFSKWRWQPPSVSLHHPAFLERIGGARRSASYWDTVQKLRNFNEEELQ